ncbi:MAG: hypothetical protein QWI36_01375 [Wolbachia endosymbiont of Tyrophagus putrescentiae]|nr:hypothetical protein [Wolbachia endosymbiont of Tyrophagus putrescentiae]
MGLSVAVASFCFPSYLTVVLLPVSLIAVFLAFMQAKESYSFLTDPWNQGKSIISNGMNNFYKGKDILYQPLFVERLCDCFSKCF